MSCLSKHPHIRHTHTSTFMRHTMDVRVLLTNSSIMVCACPPPSTYLLRLCEHHVLRRLIVQDHVQRILIVRHLQPPAVATPAVGVVAVHKSRAVATAKLPSRAVATGKALGLTPLGSTYGKRLPGSHTQVR